jgi:hypothetical protein
MRVFKFRPSSIKIVKVKFVLTDEQETTTEVTVCGINDPGCGITNDKVSPFAKTDLSKARVNCILETRLTWEGVGTPTTLKNLGALQLWQPKLMGQRVPEHDS